jgi:hypothetical protein
MLRVIKETRPAWVLGENVAGSVKMELDNCLSDLEALGYAVQPLVIQLVPSTPNTGGTGSGLWPTPRANKVQVTNQQAINRINQSGYHANLEEAVALSFYPTPTSNEDAAGTPNAKMQKQLGNHPAIRGTTPQEWQSGSLNPAWVEWLMGYPIGHTDCGDWETPSSRKLPNKSSKPS